MEPLPAPRVSSLSHTRTTRAADEENDPLMGDEDYLDADAASGEDDDEVDALEEVVPPPEGSSMEVVRQVSFNLSYPVSC